MKKTQFCTVLLTDIGQDNVYAKIYIFKSCFYNVPIQKSSPHKRQNIPNIISDI